MTGIKETPIDDARRECGLCIQGNYTRPMWLNGLGSEAQLMSRPPANNPWIVFDYEVEMFSSMIALLQTGYPDFAKLPHNVRNAVVESALLHTRQLVEILLSRGHQRDDINLSELSGDFVPTRRDELEALYGGSSSVDSPCWTINKRLAHATTHRGSNYDYADVLNLLVPLIADIIREV